jgi:hypothetical protein
VEKPEPKPQPPAKPAPMNESEFKKEVEKATKQGGGG